MLETRSRCRLVGVFVVGAIAAQAAPATADPFVCDYLPRVQVGTVAASYAPVLNEASGLVQSRRDPEVFWSHQDNGGDERIFALRRDGSYLGTWDLAVAPAADPEDIAIGPGPVPGLDYVYLGDVGHNYGIWGCTQLGCAGCAGGQDCRQRNLKVWRAVEPAVTPGQPFVAIASYPADTITLAFPDAYMLGQRQDVEGMLVDPLTGDLYVVTKRSTPGMVFRAPFPQATGSTIVMEWVADLPFGGNDQATGADISSDGRLIAVRRYHDAFVWQRAPGTTVGAALAGGFCQIFGVSEYQGEAIALDVDDSGSFYTVSEGGGQVPIWFYERASSGCQSHADCDDGLFCNGAESCGAGGQCQSGSTPACPGQVCSDGLGACVDCAGDTECDDGKFCNGAETCNGAGQCVPGSAPGCDGGSCSELLDTCVECTIDADCPGNDLCSAATGACVPQQAPLPLPIDVGATWRYLSGTVEPGAGWNDLGFADAGWNDGASGFGYGADCAERHQTVLETMRGNHLSLYLRKTFEIEAPETLAGLLLTVDFDDAFVAYVNGVEVGRHNVAGAPPLHTQVATANHECSGSADGASPTVTIAIDVERIQPGINVIALQAHNLTLDSSDFTVVPTLTGIDAGCASDAACDDDVFCNGAETCGATGACLAGPPPCAGLACDEGQDDCVQCAGDSDCDDGIACTSDSCQAGMCVIGVGDSDQDGAMDCADSCVTLWNPDQGDLDQDGRGDGCDLCPADPADDADGDGLCGDVDNCPGTANPGQADADGDGLGDACDALGEVRFDFAPGGSLVPDDFVIDDGSTFDPLHGRGWRASVPTRERHAEVPAELDTFAFSQSLADWSVELPNGDYEVAVVIGDAGFQQGPQGVVVEGQVAFAGVTTEPSGFLQNVVRTGIRDGRLDLSIGGAGGFTTLNLVEVREVPSSGWIASVNFQPTTAAVPPGYTADDGAPFDVSRGYGWNGGVAVRDRAQALPQVLDTLAFSAAPRAWEFALEPGFYEVHVAVGDASYPQGPQRVRIEGQTVVNDENTGAGAFLERTTVVRVDDDRLTVDIGGAGGLTTLNHVVITPAVADIDDDGISNPSDNCPFAANPEQIDSDGDGIGNTCDTRRFSFAPASTPATPGYTMDRGKIFDAAAGFGWDLAVPTRERGSTLPDELDTFAFTGPTRRWTLELPNGNYAVRVVSGDVLYPQGPHRAAVGSHSILSDVMTAAGTFAEGLSDVPVRNGRLALDVGGSGGITTLNVVELVELAPPGLLRSVNFQPAGSAVPTGYSVDSGKTFDSARGYGWNISIPTRDRAGNLPQALDTLAFSSTPRTWEIDVPDGTYQVALAVGDGLFAQGPHSVTVEGVPVVSGEVTGAGQFIERVQSVVVTDGRLSVVIGGGGGTTTLNQIVIAGAE